MKKMLFFCTIVLITANCFSQERFRYGDLELWGGMPFINGGFNRDGEETIKTQLPFSFGIGAANYSVFGIKDFGISVLANFIFPETLVHNFKGQETSYSHARSDIFLIDMQFGVAYHLTGQESSFRVPVTFGLHFLTFAGRLEKTPSETHELFINSLGLGVSAAAELHINSYVYFFFRLHVFFDFVASNSHTIYTGVDVAGRLAYFIDARNFTYFSALLGLNPQVGFGFKIDGFSNTTNTN
jgi:hypothetical protein